MAVKYIVQHRRGTTEEWQTTGAEIIPLAGEIVIELCKDGRNRLKIGDGEHTYGELAYMSVDDFVLSQPTVETIKISLPSEGWQLDEETSAYYQPITISGVTSTSKVDLQPSPVQLCIFHQKDLAFVTENDNGQIRVYSIGDKPTNDYTIQATVTEVAKNG